MRVPLETLMEKLGIGRVLHPYETQPWLVYDEERGITCSAEIRMGPGGQDLETEIQFLYDEGREPPPPPPPEAEAGSDEPPPPSAVMPVIPGMPYQIMRMQALPVVSTGQWSPTQLRVKGENYVNKIGGWQEKGCEFFKACIQSLQMGEIPDIEELIARELDDDNFGGGRRGRVGRKSPKVNPSALLGMKKGM